MSSSLSAETIPSTAERATNGRFAKGNPGGPGNPFARQTAALRANLLNHVTERDLQDILEVLLLNAKGGHVPSIKLLFSYVLGKPKPVVEPDQLDLQEMQMLQQSTLPAEALETVCEQLPLDVQVQLARFSQTENAADAVQTARDKQAAAPTRAPSAPSTTGDNGESRSHAGIDAPSTTGDNGAAEVARGEKRPSTNEEIQRPPRQPRVAGFAWLDELRRGCKGRAVT